MRKYSILLLTFALVLSAQAQTTFTRQDTLRGSITPERAWWDLTYYHLDIKVDPASKTIAGSNSIYYTVVAEGSVMQIDLQPPLQMTKAVQNGQELSITHEGNAHFIALKDTQPIGSQASLEVFYHGVPVEATNPPWDGGITWDTDTKGKPFIASSCQGIGASVWWPCKDHMYDEPDSMLISVNVPKDLMNVSNGRLRGIDKLKDKTITTHWFVNNPISNYAVNINIGDYVTWHETYDGEKGPLDLDYWVLRENKQKAKAQFTQTPMMLKAFEHWFGPYPFYEDGFKLVETPYLGMEHQSSITYGNGYQNGYRGRDLSRTGWGLTFDFIIIHESGHEWFANNITVNDIADMWVHESFTNYSENLYVEYYNGKEAGAAYVKGTRWDIHNEAPIEGIYHLNAKGSGDMYPKGGNMLHTLRQLVNDDEEWRSILRGLNEEFYHQTVDGVQVEAYISDKSGLELDYFFDQYLRDIRVPILEYKADDTSLHVRWNNCLAEFAMPIELEINGVSRWVPAAAEWTEIEVSEKITSVVVDSDYYVGSLNIMGEF
jgi:aminopeptidase N